MQPGTGVSDERRSHWRTDEQGCWSRPSPLLSLIRRQTRERARQGRAAVSPAHTTGSKSLCSSHVVDDASPVNLATSHF